jgi:hypothetical protein
LITPLGLVITVSLLLAAPLIWFGFPAPTHDGAIHALWAHHVATAFWDGELYPRWLPELNGGFGTPAFFFYPPLSTLSAVVFWPVAPEHGRAWYALGWGAALGLVLSGVAMYWFLRREFVGERAQSIGDCGSRIADSETGRRWVAAAGALVYVAAPYHFGIDLLDRGANAEFWAFALMPLVLLAFRRLAQRRVELATANRPRSAQSSTAVPAESGEFSAITSSARPRDSGVTLRLTERQDERDEQDGVLAEDPGGTPGLRWGRELLPWRVTALAALSLAALFCTHLLTAITFAPVALLYAWSLGWDAFRRAVVAGMWAILLSAGYLLPMALYGQYTVAPDTPFFMGEYLGRTFFFPTLTLAQPLFRNDAFNRRLLVIFIGLAVVVAASGVSLLSRGSEPRNRGRLALWFGLLWLCMVMMLPVAEPLYSTVPGLKRVQFVWRFLSPATFVACVMVTLLIDTWIKGKLPQSMNLVAADVRRLHPVRNSQLGFRKLIRASSRRLLRFCGSNRRLDQGNPTLPSPHRTGRGYSLRTLDRFLPVLALLGIVVPLVWVTFQTFPHAFCDRYGAWRGLPPLLDLRSRDANGEYLPRGASISVATELFGGETNLAPTSFLIASGHGPIRVASDEAREFLFEVNASQDLKVVWHQSWFPGWRAEDLRGTNQIVVGRHAATGLLELGIPSGEHRIRLRLSALWPERIGIGVSSVTAAFMLASVWWESRARARRSLHQTIEEAVR